MGGGAGVSAYKIDVADRLGQLVEHVARRVSRGEGVRAHETRVGGPANHIGTRRLGAATRERHLCAEGSRVCARLSLRREDKRAQARF
eukprot:6201251-Pleurochrysis_carterae.AAC.4